LVKEKSWRNYHGTIKDRDTCHIRQLEKISPESTAGCKREKERLKLGEKA